MRILWLKTELLHPVDKGGKIRTYNMLKELRREHDITYLTLDDGSTNQEARERAMEYCQELNCIPYRQQDKFSAGFYAEIGLNLLSPLPYAIKKYESKRMRESIAAHLSSDRFDVLVCDFLAPAINVPETLPCPAVLFEHNVEATIWKRHYEVQQHPAKKAYLYGQWRKMLRFEQKMCRRFDCIVTVSHEDSEAIQKEYEVAQVFDVPTGVDTEFFRSSGEAQRDPHNLVFTGSMDWLPNEDAIRYFIGEIMPLIKQRLPGLTLTVVGRNPYASLLELSRRDNSIVVTGRVDDVRPFIERAAAYVVPLRIGGGTRLKIFEAMAMEKAVVSTTVGAEGLPVRNNVELILADTPEAFASSVVRLLQDEALARSLGHRAAATVRERFGWRRVAENFASLCENSVNRAAAQAPVADESVFV